MYTWGSLAGLVRAITIMGVVLLLFSLEAPLDGRSLEGFSGAPVLFPVVFVALLLLPQKTLVTLSMTLPLEEWCLLERRPRPLMRLDNSAEARSTTPWAEIEDMMPRRLTGSSIVGKSRGHHIRVAATRCCFGRVDVPFNTGCWLERIFCFPLFGTGTYLFGSLRTRAGWITFQNLSLFRFYDIYNDSQNYSYTLVFFYSSV